MRTGRRVALVIGAFVLLVVAVLAAAMLYVSATDGGRRVLADRIEDAVSRSIPGSMRIGVLESVGTRALVVRDLRFSKTDGEPVLIVARAQIDADVTDLLRGKIAFEQARVHGGHLIIAIEPHGRTGLEAAFSETGPASGEPAELQMRSIHVQDLTLTVRPSRDDTFRMRGVEGFVAIAQHGPPGVRVRLDRISGTLEKPKFLGATAEILSADGLILGGVERVIDLKLRAELDEDRVDVHLVYYNRERPPKVELELDPKEGILPHIAAFAAQAQTMFTDDVDVRVR
jgi:hypothetical protein